MIDAILLTGAYALIIWGAYAAVVIVYRAICRVFSL